MKATLAHRAAPLLITTILVAAPAWAQQSTTTPNNPSASAPTAPGSSSTQMSSEPSGTGHKAIASHGRQAVARQPGESMQSLAERRITDIYARLHITQDQNQQWEQFAQVMRDNAKEIDQSYQQRAQKLASMSAIDNMQSYAQIEQQRAQDMQKLVPAFQTVYNSLTDQQKKAADDMFRTYAENAQAGRQSSAR